MGNRSIFGNPTIPDMRDRINKVIKKREGFRPFAPVILEEKVGDWFDADINSKCMLFTFNSSKKQIIPSCIHEDNSARVQTISKEDNSLFYELIA